MLAQSMSAQNDFAKTAALLTRVEAGDPSAWSDLYHRYRDGLLLSIRCRLGKSLAARLESEDVLQSVMREALGSLEDFEYRGQDSLQHWLHQLVLNKIRSKAAYYGAQKRRDEVPLTPERIHEAEANPTAHQLLEYDDPRFQRLERGLSQISAAQRDVILLRRIDGLDNQSCAEKLCLTPAATSKLYNRGLARLARLMGDHQ